MNVTLEEALLGIGYTRGRGEVRYLRGTLQKFCNNKMQDGGNKRWESWGWGPEFSFF